MEICEWGCGSGCVCCSVYVCMNVGIGLNVSCCVCRYVCVSM